MIRFWRNLLENWRVKLMFFRRSSRVLMRRERKTSTFEKRRKTSTGATKFKVRAFAKSSRTMKKTWKIDARAYVNEGSLQGRLRWPKPFQNPCPKHFNFRARLDFFSYFCPRAPPRASKERPRALESLFSNFETLRIHGIFEILFSTFETPRICGCVRNFVW